MAIGNPKTIRVHFGAKSMSGTFAAAQRTRNVLRARGHAVKIHNNGSVTLHRPAPKAFHKPITPSVARLQALGSTLPTKPTQTVKTPPKPSSGTVTTAPGPSKVVQPQTTGASNTDRDPGAIAGAIAYAKKSYPGAANIDYSSAQNQTLTATQIGMGMAYDKTGTFTFI